MSRQVYIGKVKSDKFDYYKEFGINECSALPERISHEKSHYSLWDDIYSAAGNNVPNAKNTGYELHVIKFSKEDLINYLNNPKYKQRPECFNYIDKEEYEKHAVEKIEYLLLIANGLADGDYLLVAYEGTCMEEFDLEELV
jgi:hypothetical protein